MSTASLARPSLPLVAMIKVVAASMMTTLKIRNLTWFDAGTMSLELVDCAVEAGMEDRHTKHADAATL
jgi:hypothetical protein